MIILEERSHVFRTRRGGGRRGSEKYAYGPMKQK